MMKKLALSAFVGAALFGVYAGVICEIKTPNDLESRRPPALREDGSFLVTRKAWVVGKQFFPADADKKYRVSCEVRCGGDKVVKGVRIGVASRNAQNKDANVSGILAVKGTETAVVVPVKKEGKLVRVKDASGWRKVPTRIVYDADPEGKMRDIPNFNFIGGRPTGWKRDGNDWVIELARPAGVELPAGTVIRQHVDYRNAIYSSAKLIAPGSWQTVEFVIGPGLTQDGKASDKLFPGVAFISPLVVFPDEMLMRHLRIEVLE